jgi:hypothetical protein
MKTISKCAKWLWIAGGLVTFIGEVMTAFDKEKGNTISEAWRDSPQPLKYFVILLIGAVLGHWCWPLAEKDKTNG